MEPEGPMASICEHDNGVHKCSPLDSILSQSNPVCHIYPPRPKLPLNVFLPPPPPTPRSSQWSLPFEPSNLNPASRNENWSFEKSTRFDSIRFDSIVIKFRIQDRYHLSDWAIILTFVRMAVIMFWTRYTRVWTCYADKLNTDDDKVAVSMLTRRIWKSFQCKSKDKPECEKNVHRRRARKTNAYVRGSTCDV
jgi:hypothetical protein